MRQKIRIAWTSVETINYTDIIRIAIVHVHWQRNTVQTHIKFSVDCKPVYTTEPSGLHLDFRHNNQPPLCIESSKEVTHIFHHNSIDRFLRNVLSQYILQQICNSVNIKDPITPQACRYTTLWNIDTNQYLTAINS